MSIYLASKNSSPIELKLSLIVPVGNVVLFMAGDKFLSEKLRFSSFYF